MRRRGPVAVRFLPGDDPGRPPAVAFAVTRSVGDAPDRNRVRRRLRAAVRNHAAELAPGAYLVSAGRAALAMSFAEVSAIVSSLLRSVAEPRR